MPGKRFTKADDFMHRVVHSEQVAGKDMQQIAELLTELGERETV